MSRLRPDIETRRAEIANSRKQKEEKRDLEVQEAMQLVKDLEQHLTPLLNEIKEEKALVEVSYRADTHLAGWDEGEPLVFIEKAIRGSRRNDEYPKLMIEDVYTYAVTLSLTIKGMGAPALTINFIPFLKSGLLKSKIAFHYDGWFYTPRDRLLEPETVKHKTDASGVCGNTQECESVLRKLVIELLTER